MPQKTSSEPEIEKWESSFRGWTRDFEQIAWAKPLELARFETIVHPNYNSSVNTFFWPHHEVQPRKEEILRYYGTPSWWHGEKGPQDTAWLLWAFRAKPEHFGATLMAAWAHDQETRTWGYQVLESFKSGVREGAKSLGILGNLRWHHASRNTLPAKTGEHYYYFDRGKHPDLNARGLAYFAAESAAMTLGTLSLVRVGRPEDLDYMDRRFEDKPDPDETAPPGPVGGDNVLPFRVA